MCVSSFADQANSGTTKSDEAFDENFRNNFRSKTEILKKFLGVNADNPIKPNWWDDSQFYKEKNIVRGDIFDFIRSEEASIEAGSPEDSTAMPMFIKERFSRYLNP